jgi:hypothetical protein
MEAIMLRIDEDSTILNWCSGLYLQGSATILECAIVTGMDLKGLQKKKHLSEAAAKFRAAIGRDAVFSDFIYAPLLKTLDSQVPVATKPVAK